MVVPEAWLSRDYAHPIQYLLLKLFRIRYVVEDAHERIVPIVRTFLTRGAQVAA